MALGVAVLGFVLSRVDLARVAGQLNSRTAPALAGATLLFLATQSSAALRWRLVLGPASPPWSYLTRLYLVGGFFNLFLPTSVGGDAVRGASLARATGRTAEAVTSLVVDRLVGVGAMILYALLGAVLAPALVPQLAGSLRWSLSPTQMAGAGVVVVGVVALLWWRLRLRPWVRHAGDQARESFGRLGRSPALLAQVVALGLVSQGLLLALWWVLAWSVHLAVPLSLLLLAVPAAALAALLPVGIGGLGVRDGVWLGLLVAAGLPGEAAVASSLLYFAATLCMGAIGGLVYLAFGTAPRG